MTQLRAQNVTVRRRARLILEDVSLEARSGEFVAVIGPNGVGKSTLLAVLAGLLATSEGWVALNGTPLERLDGKALARQRAYLPQSPRCEWPISVERLVALGLTPALPAFGGLPESFGPRIESVLALCDLLPNRLQAATTLSGGELARAMLARALVGDPDILIIDEPTSELDPGHAIEAAGRLRRAAQGGRLVLAAIHDLTLVARYATRIIALRDGRVVADGPVEAVLTSELLRTVFEVKACVSRTPGGILVDYLPATEQRSEARSRP